MSDVHHENHGHSVAAWSGVALLLVAAILIAIGVAWGIHALQIAGVVVAVIGVATGVTLSKAGFGAEPVPAPVMPDTSGDPASSAESSTGR